MATGGEETEHSGGEASACAVCLEHYRDPRLLPCLHTVCKPCILQLLVTADDGKILCPVCRSQYSLSEEEADTLPKNFIDTSDGTASCVACEQGEDRSSGNSASVWCEKCKVFLCSQHTGPHVLAFADEKHILSKVDISKQQSNEATEGFVKSSRLVPSTAEPAVPLCSRHSQPLRMYCGSCDVPICGDCTAFDHHGHTPIHYITDVVPKRLSNVEEQVDKLQRNTMKRLERALRSVDDVCSVMERRAKEVSADIREAGEKTVQAVEVHVAQLLQEVEDVKKSRLKVLGQQRDELRNHLKGAQNAIRFTRKLKRVRQWGEAFFALLQALEGQMASLLSAEIKEQPQHHTRFLFQTVDDCTRSAKAKEGIGKVAPCEASAEHSVIDGKTGITTLKGRVATFKLEAKDWNGEAMDIGGDIITVRCVASPNSSSPKVTVEDHDNGSYTISCKADDFGVYRFALFVNGEELSNQLMVIIKDFQWDTAVPEREGYIQVSDDKRTASFKSGSSPRNFYNVLGSMPMSSGKFLWRVKIGPSTYSHHCLGVAPGQNQISGCNTYSNVAYCWYSGGSAYYRDKITYEGNISWSGSDTFELCLNCDAHTLQITNLRTNETSMMSNLPEKEYCPFAAIHQCGNSVEFCC